MSNARYTRMLKATNDWAIADATLVGLVGSASNIFLADTVADLPEECLAMLHLNTYPMNEDVDNGVYDTFLEFVSRSASRATAFNMIGALEDLCKQDASRQDAKFEDAYVRTMGIQYKGLGQYTGKAENAGGGFRVSAIVEIQWIEKDS